MAPNLAIKLYRVFILLVGLLYYYTQFASKINIAHSLPAHPMQNYLQLPLGTDFYLCAVVRKNDISH